MLGSALVRVSRNKVSNDKHWSAGVVDTTQWAIRDGGGMQRLNVVRDIDGNWTFSSPNWNQGAGGSLKFADATATRFARIVLVGGANSDEQAFNKIVIEAAQGLAFPQNRISVVAPAYGAEIDGDTTIEVVAPGFDAVVVKCWKQGAGFGEDSVLGEVKFDAGRRGTIRFPADQYPHGPITVRLSAANARMRDNCYLQLYNRGGVRWNEGLPANPPPAAKGMKLVFADDFDRPLSIGDGPQFTYYDHKPPHGSQDFSTIPFTSFARANNPFAQVGGYLRIRASAKARSAGLISSIGNDGTGVTASVPCYFECRFIGPNATGSWPAFWLLTKPLPDGEKGVDELDIIEAYGGEGPGRPNAGDGYMITPHAWGQGGAGKTIEEAAFKAIGNPCRMGKFGIPSSWHEAFHTYGCKVTETETIYYCDNLEVGRHRTMPVSKRAPFYFLINLATGGGWPVDLSRYDGQVDMYVDFVRVYSGSEGRK